MQFGIRPRVPFPRRYKGFHLTCLQGRVYGIPDFLGREDPNLRRWLSHPATLSAATLQELQALVDGQGGHAQRAEVVGSLDGHDLVRYQGEVYGVPHGSGVLEQRLADQRWRNMLVRGHSPELVAARLRAARDLTPVEFAGWVPIFQATGNCGQHPQFTHTTEPPHGYHFTCDVPLDTPRPGALARGVGWLRGRVRLATRAIVLLLSPLFVVFRGGGVGLAPLARLRVLIAMTRLFFTLLGNGCRLWPVLTFLRSRHYRSQVLLARKRGLAFLPSVPFTYGQNPWVIEIEDPCSLFWPFWGNGDTSDLRISESSYFPIVKSLLESDQCRGIITHMRSTADMLPTLFGSETISRKVHHVPLGVRLPRRWQRHARQENDQVLHLVFLNSWHQHPSNFFVRGGLDVLEAFDVLHERYPQLRLTLRTCLPELDRHYHRIIQRCWVRVIDQFLSVEELESLLADSHIFLLPAARIHVVSLLQAMGHGLAVVASDGWGIEEYLEHERNGLVVKGRYGKVSWIDHQAGLLREDYEPMRTPDAEVTRGIVEAVSHLVEDSELRARLGQRARADVETKFSIARWNQGLKAVFDRAGGPAGAGPVEPDLVFLPSGEVVPASAQGGRYGSRNFRERQEGSAGSPTLPATTGPR